MATFSDLPIELVVQVMIQLAIPQGYHSALARNPDTTWDEHSGSILDAYNLAITNKKHYSAFKDQQRQIFSAVMKELLLPTERRYNITLKLGDIRVVSNEPEPGYQPTKITIHVDCDEAQENLYVSLIKYFQQKNIHHIVSRPATPLGRPGPLGYVKALGRPGPFGYVMSVGVKYLLAGKRRSFGLVIVIDSPQRHFVVNMIDPWTCSGVTWV